MQGDKYAVIVGLEQELRQVEESYCYAAREGAREEVEILYAERGLVIRELQDVT